MGAAQKRKILRKRMKHAKKRFKERHGLYLTEHDIMLLIDQIATGKSKFVMRFTNRRTLHKVLHSHLWIPVVYSTKSKIIITVYNNKWIRHNQGNPYVASKKVKKKKPKKNRIHWEVRDRYSKKARME